MNQDKIGKFIAQRRKARGFLQKDIAERLGVSEKTISKWECGNGLPDVEIMRSYVFMAPEVRDGEINIDALLDYINAYLRYGSLKPYDVENAGRFFFYFLAVCNFYEQYYASLSGNRTVYLEQANMAAGLLSWFAFSGVELIRREMFQSKLLGRLRDGSQYWREI